MLEALDIRVRGIVQGVGFRPFVYHLAHRFDVKGWVLNDREGVLIHTEAESSAINDFVEALHMQAPPAAKVSEVELHESSLQSFDSFEIHFSDDTHAQDTTLVSPDLGICDDCARELFDEDDRRYRYPFINCTNCGPRFTIIDELPYDRANTSMKTFEMCPSCSAEYQDPTDRRFHAQPDACFTCGPHLSFALTALGANNKEIVKACAALEELMCEKPSSQFMWAHAREQSDAFLSACVGVLEAGGIVALKGLGGFHLVCDATNEKALQELRERKQRNNKAFAVMAHTIEAIQEVCELSREEEAVLKTPARPIVLLRKRQQVALAKGLADNLPELGLMLAATPLQKLLMHDYYEKTGCNFLVMTSGNIHSESIVIDDGRAQEKLGTIADVIVGNDRKIRVRFDDSVLRVVKLPGDPAIQFLRRARGYAPVPLTFHGEHASSSRPVDILAVGAQQKNTFTFLCGQNTDQNTSQDTSQNTDQTSSQASEQKAFVSQYIGDLEDADVFDSWIATIKRFQDLFDLRYFVLACDRHTGYSATKWAHDKASRRLSDDATNRLDLIEVQHHHAHIASVLGEHHVQGPAIGIALDGTGAGPDGAVWGGEVLIANQADYERFANFAYVPMPGGEACVHEPLRMAYGFLWAYDLLDHPGARQVLDALGSQAQVCSDMIEKEINTPYTSSLGRFFDAVAALLGIAHTSTYEGEAAILLDAAKSADVAYDKRYAISLTKNAATKTSTAHDTSVVLFDLESTLRALLDDISADKPAGDIAAHIHHAVVDALVQVAELARAMYDISLVALSGGCFMNRYLLEQTAHKLHESGFTLAVNANLPPNDGCLSFGQATVAAARTSTASQA